MFEKEENSDIQGRYSIKKVNIEINIFKRVFHNQHNIPITLKTIYEVLEISVPYRYKNLNFEKFAGLQISMFTF